MGAGDVEIMVRVGLPDGDGSVYHVHPEPGRGIAGLDDADIHALLAVVHVLDGDERVGGLACQECAGTGEVTPAGADAADTCHTCGGDGVAPGLPLGEISGRAGVPPHVCAVVLARLITAGQVVDEEHGQSEIRYRRVERG
jgi:hypothetical protein